MPLLTVHDSLKCFFIHAPYLDKAIHDADKQFFELDFLNQQVKPNHPEIILIVFIVLMKLIYSRNIIFFYVRVGLAVKCGIESQGS